MIVIKQRGSFKNTMKFLNKVSKLKVRGILEKYGQRGVNALSAATPKESGKTAGAWAYEINETGGGYSINWTNSNINDGVNIAVILQYGHGTGTGGYVEGRDYINPALRPVFDDIAESIWREVTEA